VPFRRCIAVLALGLAALATAAPARADDTETFFAKGRSLRAEGKCAEALIAFRLALDLKPQGLGALRNIAECEEQLGQLASARTHWWSLRRAALQSSEPKYEGWSNDAEQAYKRLEDRVARLTVRLVGAGPERASVLIDGQPLDPRLLDVELERDIGPHTIEVSYGGAAPIVEKRTLAAGARETVTLTLPTRPAETPGSSGLRTVGLVSLGSGGAGVLGFAISLALRQSALSAVQTACPDPERCIPADRAAFGAALDRGQTASTLVNVFAGLAVAGAGAGVALLVISTGPKTPAQPGAPKPATAGSPGLEVGLAARVGGGQIWAGGRF
jgi:hypothetical protein